MLIESSFELVGCIFFAVGAAPQAELADHKKHRMDLWRRSRGMPCLPNPKKEREKEEEFRILRQKIIPVKEWWEIFVAARY